MRRRNNGREGVGAAATARGGGGDERVARFSAVVEELHRFTRGLQTVNRSQTALEQTGNAPVQQRAAPSTAEGDGDSDEAETTMEAVATSIAAASARRRASGGAGVSAVVGAGDGGGTQTGSSGASPLVSLSQSRMPASRIGSASMRGATARQASNPDWRERIPTIPLQGRAPAYPQKPERGRFVLPSPTNQRDAPRSLVEWYMTRVYDPVKVNERAQRLAEGRERQKLLRQQAQSPPTSTGEGEEAASERPASEAAESSVGGESEDGAASVSPAPDADWIWATSTDRRESDTDTDITSRPVTAVTQLPSPPTSQLLSPPPTQQASWQRGDECYIKAVEEAETEEMERSTPAGGGWSVQAPLTALMRNRAHVLGSSLQLGSATVTPRFRAYQTPILDNSGGMTSIAGMGLGGMSGAAEATAAAAAAGAETMAQVSATTASDEAAFERRRIRRKMMGGGRPDWLNFDGADNCEWGTRTSFLRPRPPSQPPTLPQSTSFPSGNVLANPREALASADHMLMDAGNTPLLLLIPQGQIASGEASTPRLQLPCSPTAPPSSPTVPLCSPPPILLPERNMSETTISESEGPMTPPQRGSSSEEQSQMTEEERERMPLPSSLEKLKCRRRRRSEQDLESLPDDSTSVADSNSTISSRRLPRTCSAKTTVLRRVKTTLLPGKSAAVDSGTSGAMRRMAARVRDLRVTSYAEPVQTTRTAAVRRASSGMLPLSLSFGRALAEARAGSATRNPADGQSPVARLMSAARRAPHLNPDAKSPPHSSLSPRCSPTRIRRENCRGIGGGGGGGGMSGSEPRPLTREATFSLPDNADSNALSRRRT